MKTRLFALLTAGMMLGAAVSLPPVQALEQPEEDPVIGEIPDWVPKDFADAMQFYNTHGKTYVEDNVICLVRPMIQWKLSDYTTSLDGSMTTIDESPSGEPKTYELDIPEKPDPSDESAVAEFEAYCDRLGIYNHDYSFFESYAACKTQYAFKVELFRVLEGYDLTVVWSEKTGDASEVSEIFHFENPDGTTVETDIYSWLPDCAPEHEDYYGMYGRAAVHGGYITYCFDESPSTGAVLSMEQNGDGAIKEVMQSECKEFQLMPLDGEYEPTVYVYQPTADGQVTVNWTINTPMYMDPIDTAAGVYQIRDNGAVILDLSPDRRDYTIFTFIDQDTGKRLDIPKNDPSIFLEKIPAGEDPVNVVYSIRSNPCTVNSITSYDPACSYAFHMETDAGSYGAPQFEVTSEVENIMEVTCKLKWTANGDANRNRFFNTADLVLLNRYLTGVPDSEIYDLNSVDFCRDGQIDVFDLCMMKRELLKTHTDTPYIEPDFLLEYGTPFTVIADELTLRLGPGEQYDAVASIPKGTELNEKGYLEGVNQWLFTEYNGQFGWIPTVAEDGKTPTIYYEAMADKPVIYLYPEHEAEVHVSLELTESDLSTTYPKYQDGWDVVAYPDGTLLNKADGSHHRYLFWDSTNCRTRFDFSKGFCVAGSDTEQFLKETLTAMGLTEDERNEFIVYWLPRMEHNAYNLIAFQGDAYTNTAKLGITPQPDSLCRVFMAYVPLEQPVEIEPQTFSCFERKGFTVLEWGGVEINAQ